jgi:23S rRNA pseudouridine1911/1915/1917 synthase
MNEKNTVFTVSEAEQNERLDQVLAKRFPLYSRNYFLGLIKRELVLSNGKTVKASHKTKEGDSISVAFTETTVEKLPEPQEIELNIIFENDDVIVINKQPGLVVHPAAGNLDGTLINALLFHFPKIRDAVYEKDNMVSENRPGLVHRLDKNTSGAIIIAKNARAMHSLSRQIQNRTVSKIYEAICYGWPKNDQGILKNFLGRHLLDRKVIADIGENRGKLAITHYKVLKHYQDKQSNKYSLIEFDIKTGRTHQIRSQAKILGNPVIGDEVYGTKESLRLTKLHRIARQLLHSKHLTISLPGDEKPTTFVAPLPKDMSDFIDTLKEI